MKQRKGEEGGWVAFRRHSEFQISASFYDVITNDTVGEQTKRESLASGKRVCRGGGDRVPKGLPAALLPEN